MKNLEIYRQEKLNFFKKRHMVFSFVLFKDRIHFMTIDEFNYYLRESLLSNFYKLEEKENYKEIILNTFQYFVLFIKNVYFIKTILNEHLILLWTDLLNEGSNHLEVNDKIFKLYLDNNLILYEDYNSCVFTLNSLFSEINILINDESATKDFILDAVLKIVNFILNSKNKL